MKADAVVFTGAGGVEVIALGATEVRDPGPGEIQVEIAAAGLNRADVLQRRGFYPAPPGTVADVPEEIVLDADYHAFTPGTTPAATTYTVLVNAVLQPE